MGFEQNPLDPGLEVSRILFYRATLDVPKATARTIAVWLANHRRVHDIHPRQRAATCWKQAILVLRWLTEATNLRTLARDTGISIPPATATPMKHST